MRTLVAKSIPDAFKKVSQLVEVLADTSPPYCWFRGSSNSEHSLLPGAYRRKGYNEYSVFVDFVQGGIAFADVGGIDSWDAYCLAQHHGMPTRLLDWTESFSAALFFAFDGWNGRSTPCVWILEPGLFNQTFLEWPGVFSPQNTVEMRFWLPHELDDDDALPRAVKHGSDGLRYDNAWPVAIIPRKANRRIHAQQGVFTVHGAKSADLVGLVEERGGASRKMLAKLCLVDFDKRQVFNDLSMLGIHRSAVYPDLDNFVKHLQLLYGWK